jgi:formamidopyrimidine-DNA glycosylase
MPELPDVTVYVDALNERLRGATLDHVILQNPFILRSVTPPPSEVVGHVVLHASRLGKRIVIALADDYFIVMHLMIAGRLHWRDGEGKKVAKKIDLFALRFSTGTLTLTEASTKKRASLFFVCGRDALQAFDRGGLEVMNATVEDFTAALHRESHTLKRTLTDPRLLSGIGNAYSDEILHRAQLSPTQLTKNLSPAQIAALLAATQAVMREWTERLRAQAAGQFPEKVTAFHPEMAVHGKYGQPCPVCGGKVQRIVYATNEANYCPRCQTGGKLLADRALSRLLKGDWPKTIEELEERKNSGG